MPDIHQIFTNITSVARTHGAPRFRYLRDARALMSAGGNKLIVVRVSYCPTHQPAAKALAHGRFRVGERTTFTDLRATAAHFFTVNPNGCVLSDENGAQWPLLNTVWNAPPGNGMITVRLLLVDTDTVGEPDDERPVEAAEAVDKLLHLIGEPDEDGDGEPDEAEEEDDDDGASSESSAWSGDQVKAERNVSRWKVVLEVGLHVLFCLLLGAVSFSRRDVLMSNKLVSSFRANFVQPEFGKHGTMNFSRINGADGFWTWLNSTFADGLFDSDLDGSGSIMGYTRLVGSIRLRQLRVSNTSCTLPASVRNKSSPFVAACWAPYREHRRDEAPFGPGAAVPGFSFASAAELFPNRQPLVTGRSASYDASGYVRDVGPTDGILTRDTWEVAIAELRQFGWVDRSTRALLVSMLAYNRNFELMISANFIFERSAGGQLHPLANFRTMPTAHFWGNFSSWEHCKQRIHLWMDVPLLVYWAGSVCVEVHLFAAARSLKGSWLGGFRKYFGGWAMLQWLTLSGLTAGFIFRAMLFFDPFFRDGYVNPDDGYLELAPLMETWGAMCWADASVLLLSCPKFIRFFLYTDTPLRVLSLSLSRAFYKFAFAIGLVFLFLIAMFIMAQQIFGFDMPQFATPGGSLLTLLRMMVGDVDPVYYEMVEVDQGLAIVYFTIFAVLFLFVLTSLFLAITSDAYAITTGAMEFAEEDRKARDERAKAKSKKLN